MRRGLTMRRAQQKARPLALAFSMLIACSIPSYSFAQRVDERPSGLAMGADMLFVRPAMLGFTAVGTAFFVISSPFSILGGNFFEAGKTLAWEPFKSTFFRCLGCSERHLSSQNTMLDRDI